MDTDTAVTLEVVIITLVDSVVEVEVDYLDLVVLVVTLVVLSLDTGLVGQLVEVVEDLITKVKTNKILKVVITLLTVEPIQVMVM